MIKDIRKAALGYSRWKDEQTHFRKPWRFPEDITLPRILISDCLDQIEFQSKSKVYEIKQKKESKTISLPSTPTTQFMPISNVFPTNLGNGDNHANGNSLPTSTTGSPLAQKKVKKKFKFKFDKKSTE